LVIDAWWKVKEVEFEGADILADSVDFDLRVFLCKRTVAGFPVKDNERDLFSDQVADDVSGKRGLAGSGVAEDAEVPGEFGVL